MIYRVARGFLFLTFLQVSLYSVAAPVLGEDWPWFLGPKHTGESGETELKPDWTDKQPPVLWKQPIGTGYSAP